MEHTFDHRLARNLPAIGRWASWLSVVVIAAFPAARVLGQLPDVPEPAHPDDSRIVFSDDFQRDSRPEYKITGPVTWEQGRLELQQGAGLAQPRQAGSVAEFTACLDWHSATQDTRQTNDAQQPSDPQQSNDPPQAEDVRKLETRMLFELEAPGKMDLGVILAGECSQGKMTAEARIVKIITRQAGLLSLFGGKTKEVIEPVRVFPLELRPSDDREEGPSAATWSVRYSYGLVEVFRNGKTVGAGYFKESTGWVAGVKLAQPAGKVRCTKLRLVAEARTDKTPPDQYLRLIQALALNQKAVQLREEGKAVEAVGPAERALAIFAEVLGEEHALRALALNNLGVLSTALGDFARAESLHQKAEEVRRKTVGARHPDYAYTRHNQADLCSALGEYARADRLSREAHEIFRYALGPRHPNALASLYKVADTLWKQGRYTEAEPLIREALSSRRDVLGEGHPDTIASRCQLAWLHVDTGDYLRAKELFQEVLAARRKAFGENRTEVANAHYALGTVLRLTGDYPEAEANLKRSLDIHREASGEDHLDYATSLNGLAIVYLFQGEYDKAQPLLTQSLQIKQSVLGETHADYAASLNNLAAMHESKGEFALAEKCYGRALETLKAVYGETHPSNVMGLENLGKLYWAKGDTGKASALFRRSLEIAHSTIRETFTVLSERQQIAMSRTVRTSLDPCLSIAVDEGRPGRQPYQHALGLKGAVFAGQQASRAGRNRPELASVLGKLESTTRRLSGLCSVVPTAQQYQAWQRQIKDLSEGKERLEAELARRSAGVSVSGPLRALTPEQLQAALPPGAGLVDFLEYTHIRPPEQPGGEWEATRRFAAFVVRAGEPVELVDVGPAEPVEQAIDAWRDAILKGMGGSTRGDRRLVPTPAARPRPQHSLRELVWQPLEKHLAGIEILLISPDGSLARCPFAALPGKEPGSYLLEEVPIAVVPVPQVLPDLLGDPEADPAGKSLPAPRRSILLVGDVDFGADPGEQTDRSSQHLVQRSAARGAVRSDFAPLPGTAREIDIVEQLFRNAYPDASIHVVRQAEATEESFRREARGCSYLHLATHGFFAPPSVRSALERPAAGRHQLENLADTGRSLAHHVTGYHPGLLSGIILAGGNRGKKAIGSPKALTDDGVLTASEVAELDLRSADLVVLSACETGLGKVAGGEGILGLQRAFQVAGAETVVASLWQVDDTATRALMVEFYKNLWEKKLGKLEALRQAQLAMLHGKLLTPEETPTRDSGDNDPPATLPPRLWAGFVLSGDWR